MLLRYTRSFALAAAFASGSALAAQQAPSPDLSGTWVLNVPKSWETGRELKYDTTTFTRDGATYRVRVSLDHGHGPAAATKTWPTSAGDISQPNSIGFVEHVITRVRGDTISYIDEFIDQGRQFNQTTGRTWLSKDGKTRTDQFEILTSPEPTAGMFVFEKK